jgi:hypothetical protein
VLEEGSMYEGELGYKVLLRIYSLHFMSQIFHQILWVRFVVIIDIVVVFQINYIWYYHIDN